MRTLLHRHHTYVEKSAPAQAYVDPSQKFRVILNIFDTTKAWPTEDDPIHGKTMKIVKERFAKSDFRGNAFTFDIYEMFKRRGYALPAPKRLKAVRLALEALERGERVSTKIAADVRDLFLDKKISEDDITNLKQLNFNF